jgi:hypothetical protein
VKLSKTNLIFCQQIKPFCQFHLFQSISRAVTLYLKSLKFSRVRLPSPAPKKIKIQFFRQQIKTFSEFKKKSLSISREVLVMLADNFWDTFFPVNLTGHEKSFKNSIFPSANIFFCQFSDDFFPVDFL